MTAEIAIINKNAVALAADSAVTLTVGRKQKSIRSADKIFELSTRSPIALMFFNNLQFMEVPIDVLAKDFRNTEGSREFSTVVECSKVFLDYLKRSHPFPEKTYDRHISTILYEEFRELDETIANKLHAYMQTKPGSTPYIRDMFIEAIKERISDLVNRPAAECFMSRSPLDLANIHDRAVAIAYRACFPHYPLNDEDIFFLRALEAV